MTVEGEYQGPERRKDYLQLDSALAEVQKLHGVATTLANAVANTPPRQELEALKAEVKRERLVMTAINSALTFVIILFLMVFFNIKLNNLSDSIKNGHEVIACLQGRTEAQRTGDLSATALIACEQTTR